MARNVRMERYAIAAFAEDPAFRADARETARALKRALLLLAAEPSAVSLFLLTNPSMARLNEGYRGKKGPTTVLSFAAKGNFPHPELGKGARRYLGEIYLAPRVIRARGERTVRMAVHGVLHLLGYAHERKSDRMVMETREAEVLGAIDPRSADAFRPVRHPTKRYATHHRRT